MLTFLVWPSLAQDATEWARPGMNFQRDLEPLVAGQADDNTHPVHASAGFGPRLVCLGNGSWVILLCPHCCWPGSSWRKTSEWQSLVTCGRREPSACHGA